MEGFQKPARPTTTKQVGLAIVKNDGRECVCSCGWSYGHQRNKVREDAIDRHLAKKHNGRGMRL